ncbi:MAG: GNAT family N-acetyltransferase [Pseudonocardiales bacterium]
MSAEQVTIRPALAADVDAITAIHAAARNAYYAAGGQPAPGSADSLRPAWATAQSLAAPHALICAEVAGRVVGLAAMNRSSIRPMQPAGSLFELHALHVDPQHWGCGVGDRMHTEFLQHLRRGGFNAGVLDVWDGNERARRFYQRRGWTFDGRSRPGPRDSQYLGMTLPAQDAVIL